MNAAVPLNGHLRRRRRSLTNEERQIVRREFRRNNGIIEKNCASRIRDMLPSDVSVFQVVGAIVMLHREVKNGTLLLRDMAAYKAALTAHRDHWLTYRGEKYDQMRRLRGLQ